MGMLFSNRLTDMYVLTTYYVYDSTKTSMEMMTIAELLVESDFSYYLDSF